MSNDKDQYVAITIQNLKLKEGDVAPVDLHVFLFNSNVYHPVAKAGDVLDHERMTNLIRLSGRNLYVTKTDFEALKLTVTPAGVDPAALEGLNKGEVFKDEVLGDAAKQKLKNIYEGLLSEDKNQKHASMQAATSMADALVDSLAPEVKDTKASVLKMMKNLHHMNHTAAITSISILVALANGFESKTAFNNLCLTAVLMDVGMGDMSEADVNTYYENRSRLPLHIWERMKLHPVRSIDAVRGMKISNETILQMILHHHELHNGKGYHRGVRTGSTAALSRIMAFAVDIYETMKSAELNGKAMDLAQVIVSFQEKTVEPQERRHSSETVAKVIAYLGIPLH